MTVRSPPVSSRSVLAVIVPSSVAARDNVPVTSVPAVIALEDVKGSNFTAPVPAFTEPVKLMLLVRIVTSVLVTAKAAPNDNSAVVEVEASKTIDT